MKLRSQHVSWYHRQRVLFHFLHPHISSFTAMHFRPSRSSNDPAHVDREGRCLSGIPGFGTQLLDPTISFQPSPLFCIYLSEVDPHLPSNVIKWLVFGFCFKPQKPLMLILCNNELISCLHPHQNPKAIIAVRFIQKFGEIEPTNVQHVRM